MVQASTFGAAHERVRALAAELAAADGESPRLVETPISWVLLARSLAYKIKKPVRLPFLDFTSLAARRRFCDEELRLNRRFAPSLYLDVVEVRDAPDGASLVVAVMPVLLRLGEAHRLQGGCHPPRRVDPAGATTRRRARC